MSLKLSEPSVSVRAAETSSAIAVSSFPVASVKSRSGSSATAATVTSIVPVVVAKSPFSASVEVTETPSVKSASLPAAGVTAR